MKDENISAARLIKDIKDSLKYENRFIVDKIFNDLLLNYCEDKKTATIINKGEILFRARIYTEDDRHERKHNYKKCKGTTWEGYDKEGSFVNFEDKWNPEGRMNPSGIKYLYTATDIETCLAEIKPYGKTLISIAEIKILQNIRIVDFSKKPRIKDSEFMASFSVSIDRELSRGDIGKGDYIFSQYIAEFCKINKKDFDGLAYSSSFNEDPSKKNVTIFNYGKCKAISSKLYFTSGVCVKGRFLDDDYPVGTQVAHKAKTDI